MRAPVAKISPLQAKNSFDYWVWILLFVFITGASLFYIRTHMQAVELGYKITDQLDFKQKMVEENKLLNLEIAKLKDPHRLASEAKEKLNFITPQPDQVVTLADWKNSKPYQLALKTNPPSSHAEPREAPLLSQNAAPDTVAVIEAPIIPKNAKTMKARKVQEVATSSVSAPKKAAFVAQKTPALPHKKEVKKLNPKPAAKTSSLAIAQTPKNKDKTKEFKTKSVAKNTPPTNSLPLAKSSKILTKAGPGLTVAHAPKLSDSSPAKTLAKPEARLSPKKNKETLPAVILDTMP